MKKSRGTLSFVIPEIFYRESKFSQYYRPLMNTFRGDGKRKGVIRGQRPLIVYYIILFTIALRKLYNIVQLMYGSDSL